MSAAEFKFSAEAERTGLLTPGEVAALFRVAPCTVASWRRSGRLTAIRTPGGEYRYEADRVRAILNGGRP